MVSITIQGNQETQEYQDAIALKKIFEQGFSNTQAEGHVLIISNATLFGQNTKDIDLIVVGQINNFSVTINTKHEFEKEIMPTEKRRVFINTFCFVVETKHHTIEGIQQKGLYLLVKYGDRYSDVTTQSEKQKYALKNFLEERIGRSPFVCNFIWLRNVSSKSIRDLVGENDEFRTHHNYLPSVFSLNWLFQLACVQKIPFTQKDQNGSPKSYSSFAAISSKKGIEFDKLDDAFSLFERTRQGIGDLTRKKIEQITKNILGDQEYAKTIGQRFLVISGRAGTGKTIKLLRIAHDLSEINGYRCLILTYNHALVFDIKRILHFTGISDSADKNTVDVSTVHKFIYSLLGALGIVSDSKINNFISRYDSYLQEIKAYLNNGLIDDSDVYKLFERNHDLVGWDFILIDESQDWQEEEKDIIIRLFGHNKLIIADGIDQLVRSQNKCDWLHGLKAGIHFTKTHEKRGLRQQVNLVRFVNKFADVIGINWQIEPKEELIGGNIIIINGEYSGSLHKDLYESCLKLGNTAYEMLFLVPPTLVTRHPDNSRYFTHLDKFSRMGIQLWDGTSLDTRKSYPVELDKHRLLQYDSCRGLEGWTVVCLDFDSFWDHKKRIFNDNPTRQELQLETFEEKRDRFVALWSLIPFTRAINTLVISLRNSDSEVALYLNEVYQSCPDFVEWVD